MCVTVCVCDCTCTCFWAVGIGSIMSTADPVRGREGRGGEERLKYDESGGGIIYLPYLGMLT